MMDNYNNLGRASPYDFGSRKNVFSNVGKVISNQDYNLPQPPMPMLNRIGTNIFDTSLNQHGLAVHPEPRHRSHGSLADNMGRDEYRRYVSDKLTQIRSQKPDSRGPGHRYSPERFQDQILNAERYQRASINPAPNNQCQNYAQRPIASPPKANPYPQQISSSPLLPNINAPQLYNALPYNQLYGYPQHNVQGQGGYLPAIPRNNELKSTFDRQTQILEKISKAMKDDRKHDHAEPYRHRNTESDDIDAKFAAFERAMELKMKLMNQGNNIARMNQNQNYNQDYNQNYNQNYHQNNRKREYVEDNAFTFNQNIAMPPKQETPNEFKDYMLNFQGYLISQLSASNQLMQYQYAQYQQYQQQLQQQYQQYQPFMFGKYGGGGEDMSHSPSHRSKKKSKKSKKSPRDQTPPSEQPQQSQSHSQTKSKAGASGDSDKKTKRSAGGEGTSKKASIPSIRNPSLKIQNTTLYTDPKVSRQGSVAGDPEERSRLALRNMRKTMWAIAYPQILKKDVARRVQDRKDALMKKLLDSGEPAEKSLAVWVLNLVDKPVRGFINEKKSYDFVGSPETGFPSNTDMKERSTKIKHLVTQILDSFAFGLVSSPIDNEGLEFLASMALEGRYALDKTLFNYELMRMNFNLYGRYLGMTNEQSCMIITCLLIVRLLIFELLLSVKKWNDTVEWTDQLQLNVKILASVIYRITLSMLDDKVHVINLSPSMLPIKARPPEKSNEKNQDPVDPDESEMILDLFEQEQLHLIFSNNQWVGSVKETLRKAIESIYAKVVEYRQQQPQEQQGQAPAQSG